MKRLSYRCCRFSSTTRRDVNRRTARGTRRRLPNRFIMETPARQALTPSLVLAAFSLSWMLSQNSISIVDASSEPLCHDEGHERSTLNKADDRLAGWTTISPRVCPHPPLVLKAGHGEVSPACFRSDKLLALTVEKAGSAVRSGAERSSGKGREEEGEGKPVKPSKGRLLCGHYLSPLDSIPHPALSLVSPAIPRDPRICRARSRSRVHRRVSTDRSNQGPSAGDQRSRAAPAMTSDCVRMTPDSVMTQLDPLLDNRLVTATHNLRGSNRRPGDKNLAILDCQKYILSTKAKFVCTGVISSLPTPTRDVTTTATSTNHFCAIRPDRTRCQSRGSLDMTSTRLVQLLAPLNRAGSAEESGRSRVLRGGIVPGERRKEGIRGGEE
ncbi:hypothetical protein RRG08_037864 [Elysia crispata]|uniref:Uncharacterized protein n=1 Tax=Elysia crispata TaxID=231223 RepID=A0AAE1DHE7_9GAST|nr:hypothetical protein RRG08_037864 [Elysia crispata]